MSRMERLIETLVEISHPLALLLIAKLDEADEQTPEGDGNVDDEDGFDFERCNTLNTDRSDKTPVVRRCHCCGVFHACEDEI